MSKIITGLEDHGKFRQAEDLRISLAKTKPFFGSADGNYYAVSLDDAVGGNDFPERGFGRIMDNRSVLAEFMRDARKTYVDAKGKDTLQAVKKWAKQVKPSQFYASWKQDSSSYSDDSVEVYYIK